MDFRDKGVQTQLKNIEAKAGKSLEELKAELLGLPDAKHGSLRAFLQQTYDLTHVHADTLVLWATQPAEELSASDHMGLIYAGAKAGLRPLHESLVRSINEWGPYETAPKKGYVSLRRKKQFCMIGPATNTRIAVGINAKGLTAEGALRALPPGKLCPFEVNLTGPDDLTPDLLAWIRAAWDQSA